MFPLALGQMNIFKGKYIAAPEAFFESLLHQLKTGTIRVNTGE